MDPASLDDVLVRQSGLATRAQLRLLGLSSATVRRATAARADPAQVLRRIEGAYAAAARRDRPAVRSRRRS